MSAHREAKELRVYALTVGRKGPKMRPATQEDTGALFINGEPRRVLSETEPQRPGFSMEQLASFLSNVPAIGLPVVDRTGLKGRYIVRLTFTVSEEDDLPPIWVAVQQQLGLRLEPTKAWIDVLVVDHVEKPDPN